jgi:hypothetical protein
VDEAGRQLMRPRSSPVLCTTAISVGGGRAFDFKVDMAKALLSAEAINQL